MNKESLSNWNKASEEHMKSLKNVMDDRDELREVMKDHLSQFFEWDVIEFNRNFTKITLYWKHDCHPVIKLGLIKDLGMDFIISHRHTAEYGTGVVIELYPVGLPKEGEIHWIDEKTTWEED